jgi:hypothetical protein
LYKGQEVGEGRIDVLVGSLVVLELKALPALDRIHTAQRLSYLKATGLRLGLLLNFGQPRMHSASVASALEAPSSLLGAYLGVLGALAAPPNEPRTSRSGH